MILKIAGVTGRDLDLWLCVRISASSACRASMIADSNEDCGLVRARISIIFLCVMVILYDFVFEGPSCRVSVAQE